MSSMKRTGCAALALICATGFSCPVSAHADNDQIRRNVYVEDIDVGGMTKKEADKAIRQYVDSLKGTQVNININGKTAEATLEDLGLKWLNTDVVEDALGIGTKGNVIKRYTEELDVEHNGVKYKAETTLSEDRLENSLETICAPFNQNAENASLVLTDSGFDVQAGKDGVVVDCENTAKKLYEYIRSDWDQKSDISIDATTKVSKPEFDENALSEIDDTPMGTYTSTFSTGYSYSNRNGNIANGARLLDGQTIFPGEEFSLNAHLEPWTEENGYFPAGTYVDGGVSDSLGGGICQVSSTLYNALLMAEIEIVERYPHSMTVGYVPLAADAALAGDYKDLVFKNNTNAPIYIQAIYLEGSITFNVYGKDERPEGRSVSYTSETVETIPIETEYVEDSSLPSDYRETISSGHTGYIAKLWKHIYEDGVETDVELVNTSKYRMTPTKILVGTAKEEETTEPVTEEETEIKEEKTEPAREEETKAKEETKKPAEPQKPKETKPAETAAPVETTKKPVEEVPEETPAPVVDDNADSDAAEEEEGN